MPKFLVKGQSWLVVQQSHTLLTSTDDLPNSCISMTDIWTLEPPALLGGFPQWSRFDPPEGLGCMQDLLESLLCR